MGSSSLFLSYWHLWALRANKILGESKFGHFGFVYYTGFWVTQHWNFAKLKVFLNKPLKIQFYPMIIRYMHNIAIQLPN